MQTEKILRFNSFFYQCNCNQESMITVSFVFPCKVPVPHENVQFSNISSGAYAPDSMVTCICM